MEVLITLALFHESQRLLLKRVRDEALPMLQERRVDLCHEEQAASDIKAPCFLSHVPPPDSTLIQ